ncbi:M20 aminoacylase family protein [Nguyenibacter vanlangensis]|uniref:M20 aminoacylase family protein n=2 Tax=Nguyenibacter vanlangensis TaxID=1216886 RepID=A0ABZ3CZU7_9PROT
MSLVEAIARDADELTAIRRDLHAHPELGMVEHRTAAEVARFLQEWGIEVHRGVGQTGVVGVLRAGNGAGAIGLRADMDALPMHEAGDAPWRSQIAGRMHACGHDGHTTMLLGAARYLARTRNFNGTVHFIFQPGEEGCGGALAMLQDGLFERFPCDAIFGMHNQPDLPVGEFRLTPGPAMAGGGFFDITITGVGAHAARPEAGIDPVLVACHIVTALQSIVSRTVSPREPAVISVTKIVGGDAHNVIPQTARVGGTLRGMSKAVLADMQAAMHRITENVAAAFGATAVLAFGPTFIPLCNDPRQTAFAAETAMALVGADQVDPDAPAVMGSEDFAYMLDRVPGSFLRIGNGPGEGLHHPRYDFNDAAIPYGSALFAALVERFLPRGTAL